MTDFTAVKRFVEEHSEALVAASREPERLGRAIEALRRYWEDEDDSDLALEETFRVLRADPEAWKAFTEAGLAPGAPADDGASAGPSRPGSPGGSPHPSDEESRTPVGDPSRVAPTVESGGAPATPPPSPPVHRSGGAEAPASPAAPTVPRRTPQGDDMSDDKARQELRLAIWEKVLSTLKELVTAAIGLAIVVITLRIAWGVYADSPGNPEANPVRLANAKEVLLFMNGLVGVVLGYYFGRVPSEQRAATAEQAADSARGEADRARTELNETLDEVETTANEVESLVSEATAAVSRSGGAPAASPEAAAAVARLRSIARRPRAR